MSKWQPIETALTEDILPAHKGELSITHNGHKSNYETVAVYAEWQQVGPRDWVAPGEFERAVAADEIWQVQWYPDTPVGFCVMYAATFEALVEWMRNNASGGGE